MHVEMRCVGRHRRALRAADGHPPLRTHLNVHNALQAQRTGRLRGRQPGAAHARTRSVPSRNSTSCTHPTH
ncbi:hypothetical protein XFF6990_10153 [Xanthomonas citri pv. fuscans]|nr:hypothetical protein XFF6990_10153 [Xanthomonas citri pv. fuscans]